MQQPTSVLLWPEVVDCLEKKKQGFKLTGASLQARLNESDNQVPGSLFNALAAAITSFELSDSAALADLPEQIEKLAKLIELLVPGNQLVALPESLSRLHNLRTLLANNNKLLALPASIGELANLQTLNLSHNQLTELPDSFSSLQELSYVNASYNSLATFPVILTSNTKLSSLFLSHNTLQSIPSSINKLGNLTALSLDSNALGALPASLSDCSKLKTLGLNDNPFNDKKLIKVVKEGKVKSMLGHIKKFGAKSADAPPPAKGGKQPAKSYPFELLPPEEDIVVTATPDVKGVRSHIACAVLRGVAFSAETYSTFIALQTELHQTICDKRRAAAIGTHDASKISPPLTFSTKSPQDISFVPLHRASGTIPAEQSSKSSSSNTPAATIAVDAVSSGPDSQGVSKGDSVRGDQLESFFAGDQTMLKYLAQIQSASKWAVLTDDSGQVLSVPPVINSDYSRLEPSSTDVLVEVTAPEDLELAKKVLMEFLTRFAGHLQKAEQQLQVSAVRILMPGGHTKLLFPPKL